MKYPEYDSPFDIITTQMQAQMDDACFKAVQKIGINVDKDKLLEILSLDSNRYREAYNRGYETAETVLYNRNQVANILAEIVGDNCACNVNGNDEWLPYFCEFRNTSCPYPDGVSCWEQYLIHKDKRPTGE